MTTITKEGKISKVVTVKTKYREVEIVIPDLHRAIEGLARIARYAPPDEQENAA